MSDAEKKKCANDGCVKTVKKGTRFCSACLGRAFRAKQKAKKFEVDTTKEEVLFDAVVVEASEQIKKALHTPELWKSLGSLQEKEGGGLQLIDSKKELFINYRHNFSDRRSDSSLRSLTPPIHDQVKELIDTVLIRQAQTLVNRLEGRVVKINFSGFAILFALSSSFPQIPHMDAEASDYLFFYVLGEAVVPSTLVYKGDEVTDQQAAEFLNLADDTKTATIGHYKNFFQSRSNIIKNMRPVSEDGWEPGTLCVLKGGKIHAAPQHDKPRAVLVFFGTPEKASDTYKSDAQWHAWSVISDLLLHSTDFDTEQKSNLMKAHGKVIGDWLVDERCLRHNSFMTDLQSSIAHLESFVVQDKLAKRRKR